MNVVMAVVILGLSCFAVGSAAREILTYRRAARGEVPYLVSRSRFARRILISALLLGEAGLLFAGSFLLSFPQPGISLLFWLLALVVVMPVVYLAFIDMRQTRRDLDRIFQEAALSALKAVELRRREEKEGS